VVRIATLFAVFAALLVSARSAERTFDFSTNALGELPTGWRAFRAGEGKPGEWKIVHEDVPPILAPISPNAPKVTKQAVVTQSAADITDERFPILVFDGDKYGDFTFSVRFKIAGGAVEQIGGVVFRVQDEKNFYVVRASALGNNLRFYKFVDGKRQPAVGPNIEIPKGAWHTLVIEGSGNRFRVKLNGKPAIPDITDNSFPSGKVGFFTKSDSQVLFADPHIVYKPLESLATALVHSTMEKNPRLVNVRIYAVTPENPSLRVIASHKATDIGQAAGDTEQRVFKDNVPFLGKDRNDNEVLVTYPLHDRNGEPIGVAKFTLRSFRGQTDNNVLARTKPLVDAMHLQIGAAKDLSE
jgi:hypothetical protein